jgi:hypothetical protein
VLLQYKDTTQVPEKAAAVDILESWEVTLDLVVAVVVIEEDLPVQRRRVVLDM